jgi:hypothetical protein
VIFGAIAFGEVKGKVAIAILKFDKTAIDSAILIIEIRVIRVFYFIQADLLKH